MMQEVPHGISGSELLWCTEATLSKTIRNIEYEFIHDNFTRPYGEEYVEHMETTEL
jgi:hypothetical protein